jgi:hypothetical protein
MWILLLAAASTGHAKQVLSQETWLCVIGQFSSLDGTSTVEIANGAIALGTACPMTPAKVKRSKKRTVLRARWTGCEGFTGPVRVTATLATDTCNDVDVRVRAKKVRRRRGQPHRATMTLVERRSTRSSAASREGCRVETPGSAKSGGSTSASPPTSLVGAAVGALGRPRRAR